MRSYTPGYGKVQHFVAIALALGVSLGGCSQVSVPMGSNNVDTPTILTGSISSSTDIAYSDINAGDRNSIAENLDAIGADLVANNDVRDLSLHWLNSSSGNSGTLTNIDTAPLAETGCVSFLTTANTIAGIKLYSGTACRDITQKFTVTTLSVADA
ncbi:RT0821/Lpp0805 family surface protein [Roseibium sp. SCP14]|uniref:RT0821/Lpp0805 family surface protein n=1 Tax=Roseibium sp. SCP14 TaxID=3141375 RepID=UPI003335C691